MKATVRSENTMIHPGIMSLNIGEWLKLVPFFVRGRKVDSEGGGGWQFI